MYGLLRPAQKYLTPESKKIYSRHYCGQCVSLHDNFGYASRILTSYDAAFFGLLIDAQSDIKKSPNRRRCAMFPVKMNVCEPQGQAARFAAALAVCFGSMKLKDKRHDSNSILLAKLDKALTPTVKQASDILISYGISTTLIDETLHTQQAIEKTKSRDIVEYTRPTERLLSELFRVTAESSGKPHNSDLLAQIGAALGRIIYLVDACVDLPDDIVKREFNALVASYGEDGKLQHETGEQVTGLIVRQLEEIRELLSRIELNHYKDIIINILTIGLPLMIRQQISRSMNRLTKYQPVIFKYAPHAVLAAALYLVIDANVADAAMLKGEKIRLMQAYGYACSSSKDSYYCGCTCGCCKDNYEDRLCCESIINPCLYVKGPCWPGCFYDNPGGPCESCCTGLQYILQIPKALITAFGVGYIGKAAKKIITEKKGTLQKQRSVAKQEKQRQDEVKRLQDNAAYLESATKDIKNYEQSINNGLDDLRGPSSRYSAGVLPMMVSFDKKIDRVTSQASKSNNDLLYSSSREIADGIKNLTNEASNLYKDVQSVCETQEKIKQAITTVRQSLKSKNDLVEHRLTFYEGLLSPQELRTLLQDQRFDDYHIVAGKILAEITTLIKAEGRP